MTELERLQRYKQNIGYSENIDHANVLDEKTQTRIRALLNNERIKAWNSVDAEYFDFSAIPKHILDKEKIFRDSYLIFGITKDAEIISKWVDRWDLDSDDPIIDGKVILKEIDYNKSVTTNLSPQIIQEFSPVLSLTPMPNLDIFKDYE